MISQFFMILLLAFVLGACGNPPMEAPASEPATTAPAASPTMPSVPAPTHPATSTPPPVTPTAKTELVSTPKISPVAVAFLEEALQIMEANALQRERVDWQEARQEAYRMAQDAKTPAEVYTAIRFVLGRLQDGHSFLMTPEQFNETVSGGLDSRNLRPAGELLEGKIAYLGMPGVTGSEAALQNYAQTLQDLIRELDGEQPCGWIVDLTANIGGNMWPMLAGLGPLLGEGRVGAFVDAEGEHYHWYYRDGQAGVEGVAGGEHEQGLQFQLDGPVYELQGELPPVAVLTSGDTASSGESLVVALRGRPNTRSFGLPTYGVSTSNELFELSDGGALLLTTSRFADQDGQIYGGRIPPDEEVAASLQVRQVAIDWLLSLPECR